MVDQEFDVVYTSSPIGNRSAMRASSVRMLTGFAPMIVIMMITVLMPVFIAMRMAMFIAVRMAMFIAMRMAMFIRVNRLFLCFLGG
jgi:hypothetical protein